MGNLAEIEEEDVLCCDKCGGDFKEGETAYRLVVFTEEVIEGGTDTEEDGCSPDNELICHSCHTSHSKE